MISFTRDSCVDVELYEKRLNQNGGITIDVDYFRKILKYMESKVYTEGVLAMDVMRFKSDLGYVDLSTEPVISYLRSKEGCQGYMFYNPRAKTDQGSLDSKRVIAPLLAKGYATEFLTHFMKHRSYKQRCGRIRNILARNDRIVGESWTGSPLALLPSRAEIQVNDRFAYNNEDIISLPSEINNGIAAPKGKILVAGDFAQADFRIMYNLFIRSPENAAIMNAYPDKYEAMARLMHEYQKQHKKVEGEFNLEKFRQERNIYKRNILATTYGKTSGVSDEECAFIKAFGEYLDSCPRYAEFKKRIHDHLQLDLPLVLDSYFGGRSFVVSLKQTQDGTIDTALNSPIQGGTSQVVILTTNWILDKFYSLGYTPEQISVFYIRHDEPIFLMDEGLLKESWIFKEASQVQVDDWTPLEIEFNYYKFYKQRDEELQQKAESYAQANTSRITKAVPAVKGKEYYPLRQIFTLYMQWAFVGEKTIVTFYNQEKNAADYLLVSSVVPAEIENLVMDKMAAIAPRIKDEMYDGILVYSNYVQRSVFQNGCCINCMKICGPRMNPVCVLSDNMANIYAASHKIDFHAELTEDAKEFIQGVEKLRYVI